MTGQIIGAKIFGNFITSIKIISIVEFGMNSKNCMHNIFKNFFLDNSFDLNVKNELRVKFINALRNVDITNAFK